MKKYICLLFIATVIPYAPADILNWQTGLTIPGTEGITPVPNIDLSDWNAVGHNLNYADLQSDTLTGSTFENSWLKNARLYHSDLRNVNFRNSDLTNAGLGSSMLTNANLTDAIIQGANFYEATTPLYGFTSQQFYSTRSYKEKNVRGVNFSKNNLRNWNFGGLDLTSANFYLSDLDGANFSGAIIRGTSFWHLTGNSMTKDIIYSTQSYNDHDLRDINFSENSFFQWDFTGQNLTNTSFNGGWAIEANFSNANLSNADMRCDVTGAIFTNSIIKGASFSTGNGFTKEQLYSTQSYINGDLRGVTISYDLQNWDFSGQDLSNAILGSRFQGANFSNAKISGTEFYGGLEMRLTKEMLYSTKSYAEHNLEGIKLFNYNTQGIDLRNINLSNQNLKNSQFEVCHFQNANFQNTDFTNATFKESDFENADFSTAKLKNTLLSYQNFSNSKFVEADLSYAKLLKADLSGCDLTGANLTYSQFYANSSYFQDTNFSLCDFRLSSGFIPHGTTITENSINNSGYVYGLNLRPDDKLTVRTLIGNTGARSTPVKFMDSMVIAEGSKIQLVLRNYKEGTLYKYYLMYIDNGIVPDLSDGIFEMSLGEGEDINKLIGRTFYVMNWGDTPFESRYFSALTSTPNLYCDFTNFYLDGTVTIIPEPCTLLLYGLGCFGLIYRKK